MIRLGLKTFAVWAVLAAGAVEAQAQETFCNPLNLEYRFNIETGDYREAADPAVIVFQGDYYIFASKCGGYWWSPDFVNWTFVKPNKAIDIEKYAPSVWQIGDWMYYTSSENGAIYRSHNPKKGTWSKVCDNPHPWYDPWIFVDDDGRVYAYFGCGQNGDISCCELDPDNRFQPISEDVVCIRTNTEEHGYELQGDNNEGGSPWTEGGAMFKHDGKYYLTYATPGTELRTYCDGYYVSDSPMGPFTVGANSPTTFKTLGFVTGVGHGGLFTDKAGRIWTIDCTNISNKHMFERRLSIFPVTLEDDGLLHTHTTLGDYPQYVPGQVPEGAEDALVGWNLLSYGKACKASSVMDGHAPQNAVDEDMRSFWSAADGNAGQWLLVDLGQVCTVHAVQPNFYENGAVCLTGRTEPMSTKYVVEYSTDEETWQVLVDSSAQVRDLTHCYTALAQPVEARYLRVTNRGEVPGGGAFALSGFRVFGEGHGEKPSAVNGLKVTRLDANRRTAILDWDDVEGAEGYIVRFGIAPDKLWNHYMVWGGASKYIIRSLMTGTSYYFRVDAVNANGVTPGAWVYDDRGQSTAVTEVRADGPAPRGVYTLSGSSVPADMLRKPGIYVVDGKKMMVK